MAWDGQASCGSFTAVTGGSTNNSVDCNFCVNYRTTKDSSKVEYQICWLGILSNGYVGSSGLAFRYSFDNVHWSHYYSIIGNAYYPEWRKSPYGVKGKFYLAGTEYWSGGPYFQYSGSGGNYGGGGITGTFDKIDSAYTQRIYFEVYASDDMAIGTKRDSKTVDIPVAAKLYKWNINTYGPNYPNDTKEGFVEFDEYIGDNFVHHGSNESGDHNYQPNNTYGGIRNWTPVSAEYQISHMTDSGNDPLKPNPDNPNDGSLGVIINGIDDEIWVFTKWKESNFTLNPNGGMINGSKNELRIGQKEEGETPKNKPLTYNSTTWEDISLYKPVRVGYEFLGWFDEPENGNQIYTPEGQRILGVDGWWALNGECRVTEDKTLYAHWEIKNVTYVKTNENKYELSSVFIMTDNAWKPAIMYIMTDDGWKQSVVK